MPQQKKRYLQKIRWHKDANHETEIVFKNIMGPITDLIWLIFNQKYRYCPKAANKMFKN
jgi:hypothetical protein